MWVLLWCAALLHALRLMNPWSAAFCGLLYLLWYLDGKEHTGERRWSAFRNLALWRLAPIKRVVPHRAQLKGRQLFVMVPCDTVLAAVWGIGLHGGELEFADHLHYVVPPPLMWVPLLRDVLLWSGAVTWRKEGLESLLLELLNSGRSVCVCPSGFASMTRPEFAQEAEAERGTREDACEKGATLTVAPLAPQLLDFARSESLELVPVVLQRERRRYWFPSSPLLRAVQRWTFLRTGFPFPAVFALRVWSQERPPKLHQQWGPVLFCSRERFATNEELWAAFAEAVESLTCPELGDPKIVWI